MVARRDDHLCGIPIKLFDKGIGNSSRTIVPNLLEKLLEI